MIMIKMFVAQKSLPSLLLSLSYSCHNVNLFTQHMAQLNMRAARRSFLNRAVLNKNKDIIVA